MTFLLSASILFSISSSSTWKNLDDSSQLRALVSFKWSIHITVKFTRQRVHLKITLKTSQHEKNNTWMNLMVSAGYHCRVKDAISHIVLKLSTASYIYFHLTSNHNIISSQTTDNRSKMIMRKMDVWIYSTRILMTVSQRCPVGYI